MAEKYECKTCGSMTVSESTLGMCFTCQIKAAEAEKFARQGSFFFDDDEPIVQPNEGIEGRIREALDTIRITTEIGRGAMGIVFNGVQTKLDRLVAVKVLTPHPDLTGILADRFMMEAKTMAKLDHPSIITIHDFGQTDCRLSYIVMEKIDGESLLDTMERGETEKRRLVKIMAEVCDALGYAHQNDVIHRDVKPENVLIDKNGRAKVADFGLAKLEGATHAARLTKTHQMLGTPMYMAPEQATSAKNVDHRADLYAVGVMLYQILTGNLPLGAPETPSSIAETDRSLDPIVLGLLEKDPEKRIADAHDVAKACHAAADNWDTSKKQSFFGRLFGG